MNRPILNEDLELILQKIELLVTQKQLLRSERILLTGATGFFGKWLTQTLLAVDAQWGLGNQLVLVTRDRARALNESPWLRDRQNIEWLESDIRELGDCGQFDTILHGAAAASRQLNENKPSEMFDTIVDGTRRVLSVAERGCKRLLFLSSGAVYGRQPFTETNLAETYMGGPDPLDFKSAYGEAKRAAELLGATSARAHGYQYNVARCYAFLGPYLPLNTHFAAGNFLSNILQGEAIQIGGDGTPTRSYMYPADLMIWLLTILHRGENLNAYNVGSPHAVSIRELAESVHRVGLHIKTGRSQLENPIQIARQPEPGQEFERYVPAVKRAMKELGLDIWTDLDSAIHKTLRWHLD